MGHKNDYSVIAFFPNEKPKKWTFVHKLRGIANHLDKEYPDWLYMNVYERRNRQYLGRFYKGKKIPDFL